MATEAQRRAVKKYDAENIKHLHLKLNKNTDADLISWLGHVDNVQGYIKSLINRDRKISPDMDMMLTECTGVEVHRY